MNSSKAIERREDNIRGTEGTLAAFRFADSGHPGRSPGSQEVEETEPI